MILLMEYPAAHYAMCSLIIIFSRADKIKIGGMRYFSFSLLFIEKKK